MKPRVMWLFVVKTSAERVQYASVLSSDHTRALATVKNVFPEALEIRTAMNDGAPIVGIA